MARARVIHRKRVREVRQENLAVAKKIKLAWQVLICSGMVAKPREKTNKKIKMKDPS